MMRAAGSSNGGTAGEAELTQAVDKFFDLLQVGEREEEQGRSARGGREDVPSMCNDGLC